MSQGNAKIGEYGEAQSERVGGSEFVLPLGLGGYWLRPCVCVCVCVCARARACVRVTRDGCVQPSTVMTAYVVAAAPADSGINACERRSFCRRVRSGRQFTTRPVQTKT